MTATVIPCCRSHGGQISSSCHESEISRFRQEEGFRLAALMDLYFNLYTSDQLDYPVYSLFFRTHTTSIFNLYPNTWGP